ncbi:MAG: hypothetical protein M1819_006003 [Sarea resinae]|nr:MAG: hypothetical protein M1819_006003 [Sarea resinae]
MAKEDFRIARETEAHAHDEEEARSLLSEDSQESDIVVHRAPSPFPSPSPKSNHKPTPVRPHPGPPPRRQSSISYPPPNGEPRTPRTTNRVRFDIDDREHDTPNGEVESPRWMDEEDYLEEEHSGDMRSSTGQRAPLLTGIEAPSVTVASADLDFNPEDLLESARPKSGLRSAFMNMANSIM